MYELLFRDHYKITKPSEQDITRWNDYMGSYYEPTKGLRVKMEATHAGLINENLRFYIPSRMADGVKTFKTANKPTKILKHHNVESDPIGLVRDARFITTVPEDLQSNPDILTLMSATAPIVEQLQSVRRLMRAGVLSRDDWRGLGYIELVADILDKDAIDQINKGLFDAVSTSFISPGHAYCVVCDQNWAEDGPCAHMPFGKTFMRDEDDDSKDEFEYPAIIIPGLHKYLEASLVAIEGDSLANITVIDQETKDSQVFELNGALSEDVFALEDSFIYEFKDFKDPQPGKEGAMGENQKFTKLSDEEKRILDIIKKHRPDSDDDTLLDFVSKICERETDGVYKYQQEAELDDDTYVLYAIEYFEHADQEMDVEAIYTELMKELDEIDADAKLSTAQRKKLSGSTFCGPKRSFPVPDCAHVTAARRLIGRYKGPGDKSSILSCVARKAKALGCGGNSKKKDIQDTDIKFTMPSCEQLKEFETEAIQQLYAVTETELIDRQLKVPRECSRCAESVLRAENAEKEHKETQLQLIDKDNTLAVLREELHRSYADYEQQIDSYVEVGTELFSTKVEKLALMSVLSGRAKTLDDAETVLRQGDFEKEAAIINDAFSLTKIVSKLNDGMAHEPEGTVSNPVHNIDGNNPSLPTGLTEPALAAVESIRDLVKDGLIGQAKQLYANMRKMKVFDESLAFENIVSINESNAD